MKISGRGFADLLGHEAIVTRRYKDSVGVWTFGLGHTKSAGDPDPETITADRPLAEILRLARIDIEKFETRCNRALKQKAVPQNVFDAMVSFDFNTGRISNASFVRLINTGKYGDAAKSMLANYRKPIEVIGRRTKEAELMADGHYSNGAGVVMVYPASAKGVVMWRKGRAVKISDLLADIAPIPRARTTEPGDGDIAMRITDRERIKAVQQSLQDFGYPVGGIDGKVGTFTVAALAAYRHDRGLPVEDGIDQALIDDMMRADAEQFSRPISPERATKPVSEIAKESKTMQVSWWGKLLALLGLGGGTAGNAIKDALAPDQVDAHLTTAQRLFDFAATNWLMIAGIIVTIAVVFGAFTLIEHFKVRDYREGKRV